MAQEARDRVRRRSAVLFGFSAYDTLPALRCPENDVQRMATILRDPKRGCFDDVTCFTGAATAGEIATTMETLLTTDVQNGDSVLIYFSGHGKLDKHGELYLATRHTDERSLDATSLAVDRIVRYAGRSRCRSTLLILDCCYSGAIRESISKGEVKDSLVAVTAGRGLFVMTSSTNAEVSHEKEGDSLSIFTRFLAEGLESGDADLDNDGWISYSEAHRYTSNLVRGTGLQTPMQFLLDGDGDFFIGRNQAYTAFDPGSMAGQDFMAYAAVKTMADSLGFATPPSYFIVFVPGTGYDIEGFRYTASGFTVSTDHAQNIRVTGTAMECDAFFPPRMIHAETCAGKEEVNGVVKVRLTIAFKDIMIIVGRVAGGDQINLFNRN